MVQIKNGFKDYYYIDESNYRIYSIKTNKYLSLDSSNCYTLIKENGGKKHISNTNILKLVFGKTFVLKEIESLENENWKQIEESPYFISDLGRVCSKVYLESKILKPEISNGYARIKLNIGYGFKNYLVHKLVATYHLEQPKEPFMEIHHCTFDKLDNRAKFLKFMKHDEHIKIHNEYRQKIKGEKNHEQEKNTNR